ncbi:MAG: hypothetical protein AB9900_10850 [Humidesulfovibrio sp.]
MPKRAALIPSDRSIIAWTRYDGTPDSLPLNGRHLLVVLQAGYYTAKPGEVLMAWTDRKDGSISVQPWEESPEGALLLEEDDLWAYWPEAPVLSDEDDNPEELFFLQCGYSRDSLLFWKKDKDGDGYTTIVEDAEMFTRQEAEGMLRVAPSFGDRMWPASYIIKRLQSAVCQSKVNHEEAMKTLED